MARRSEKVKEARRQGKAAKRKANAKRLKAIKARNRKIMAERGDSEPDPTEEDRIWRQRGESLDHYTTGVRGVVSGGLPSLGKQR
ncbi:hypothetical protein [Bradyrhizobium sp. SZCCHNS3051]|uniref:hypothetical protein n=1 Tax=Bradyrhizobium TaxID=374 RepID=UPI002916A718|nr:hypothetical protein [Bradyrhizobium sp. SZCCHNS3051]